MAGEERCELGIWMREGTDMRGEGVEEVVSERGGSCRKGDGDGGGVLGERGSNGRDVIHGR